MKKKVMITAAIIVAIVGLLWLLLISEQNYKREWPKKIQSFCVENEEVLTEFAKLCIEKVDKISTRVNYPPEVYIKVGNYDVEYKKELNDQEILFLDEVLSLIAEYRMGWLIIVYEDFNAVGMISGPVGNELLYIEDPSLFDEFKLHRYIHYVTVINDHWYIVG